MNYYRQGFVLSFNVSFLLEGAQKADFYEVFQRYKDPVETRVWVWTEDKIIQQTTDDAQAIDKISEEISSLGSHLQAAVEMFKIAD